MQRRSIEDVVSILDKHGYRYLSGEYINPHSKLTCVDENGYLVLGNLDKLLNRGSRFPVVHSSNPYSIDNIKKIVNDLTSGEFECLSDEYVSNNKPLTFMHNVCGRTFENKWINICRGRYRNNPGTNKTGLFCPHCQTKQLESMHALVLKQVWLHEEPDTVVEDDSCVNPLTGCRLPTDIVNHRLKISIEIQSWFHDKEEKSLRDEIKKRFWVDSGYDFYAIDHRDYSVIEMIQLFFPHITRIPDYIDYDYSNKFDTIKAQELLNKHMSVLSVSEIMGCEPHKIYDSIYNGLMYYPDGYVNDCYSPVVQLDINKNFICSYDNIKIASLSTGISASNIASCLRRGRNYSGGYYWLYKKDYDSGEYTIKEYRSAKFMTPICQYDNNNQIIGVFSTIIDAEKETGISRANIYKTAVGGMKYAGGYIWKFN